MAFVIASPCANELAAECMDVCPADCIVKGPDQFYIDPTTCIECRMCEVVCPVEAIYHDTELPEEENIYLQKARTFFKS